jgi:hypothetical protein
MPAVVLRQNASPFACRERRPPRARAAQVWQQRRVCLASAGLPFVNRLLEVI